MMEKKTYRVHVMVCHRFSFTVDEEGLEQAHEIASDEALWDEHKVDCNVRIEEE